MHPSIIVRGAIARLGLRPYPLSLSYEVTWLCNLECAYCDRHTPMPRELTLHETFAALGGFYDLGMRDTHLDGGDPLTHRHIDEIVEWLIERRISVSMNTNGIIVPRKIATIRKLAGVTISMDGPRERHDPLRGAGSFDRAITGARATQAAGVPVEFTCTVGRHNVEAIDDVVGIAEGLRIPVVFQPALNSLFLGSERDGSAWQLNAGVMRAAFAHIEDLKRRSPMVGNAWSSLRHFRRFPEATRPPCAAGWVTATMDPEGVLFPCGQLDRSDRSNSVVRLGAAGAFARLSRRGCDQCWCARLVQENYAWGLRVDRMLPPLRTPRPGALGTP
jgi:MoaA/NifB/PqqE/SkfB family radical SAM enzyme